MTALQTILLISAISLGGCASNIVKPTEFGGFLTNYAQLESTTSADGSDTLRWVSPDFTPGNYSKVSFSPVVFHPTPTISEQVSNTALDDILRYCDQKIQQEAKHAGLLNIPGKNGTVSIKMAITGVKIFTEPLKPREIIPIRLVLAGAGAAIGFRDRNLDVYFEIVGKDALTQQPLFSVVHKINGEQLDSKWDQMESKHIQKAFDRFSEKAIAALTQHLSH